VWGRHLFLLVCPSVPPFATVQFYFVFITHYPGFVHAATPPARRTIRFHACARLIRLAASLRAAGTVCLAVYVSVVCVLSTYTGTRSAVTVVLRDAYVLYTYVYAYPKPPSV
jgi:hypothetical protein